MNEENEHNLEEINMMEGMIEEVSVKRGLIKKVEKRWVLTGMTSDLTRVFNGIVDEGGIPKE